MARVYIGEFPHRPGGHCSSTAMRDILKFHGHDFTEDMVFGLGAGVAFVYYENPNMEPPVYIGGRIFNFEEHLCRHLGVGMEFISALDDEQGWPVVKEMLDSRTPVMVHADVYHLDYLRARRHFGGHRIVLVGYDEEKGVAFVADNDRDTVQECSLENLEKARSSAWLPQPADNAFYRFEVPATLAPLEEAIPGAIARTVGYNLHLTPDRARFTRDGASVVRGVVGLGELADAMPSWSASIDKDKLSLLCKSIYVSVEKGGTGYGGNFRRIYGRFLKESSEVLDLPAFDRIGDEFVAIGDVWTDLALTFKEYSADGEKAIRIAQPMARDILEREKRAYGELEKSLDDLTAR